MLSGLRLRLTLLYAGAALALILLVAGGTIALLARYFGGVTDLALQHKMTHELHQLGAAIPPELAAADTDWSTLRGEVSLLSGGPDDRRREREHEDEDEDEHSAPAPTPVPAAGASSDAELAAIYVLPLADDGRVLISAAPVGANMDALRAALVAGSDLRTVTAPDGAPVRLLTYRVSLAGGPAALQLGRDLSDQRAVLWELGLGALALSAASGVLLGAASWWLAGGALRPAQLAWERQQSFIASASHELRTPLTLMRASAEVAQRHITPANADQRELLGDIVVEVDHMRALVDDLLTLSRIDSGRLPLAREPAPLADLLADLQRQAARLGEPRGVAVELGEAAGTALADRDRVRQVLLILIDNALRHTPGGGRVTLSAGAAGRGSVRLAVADTGVGIAPEHLGRVFERFYRADQARGAGSGNVGLGLSIARGLVEAMGGQIAIESAPGVGTTVTLTLPAAEEG